MTKSASMSLRMPPEIKSRLEELARVTNRSSSFLIGEAIRAYLDLNEWQIKGVVEAIRELDEGTADLVDHEAVKAQREARRRGSKVA